jgi:hypothetical protein
MNAPSTKVKCSVQECHHNKDQMCHAGDLEVNAMGDGYVEECARTQCSTFKKHSARITINSVKANQTGTFTLFLQEDGAKFHSPHENNRI